ncbi:hypothetical protein NDK25_07425 [Niallia taxi]|nr:hypothetical protein [Niallia taxi]MDE5052245.1 hypothetical protein [Niallia taxi]
MARHGNDIVDTCESAVSIGAFNSVITITGLTPEIDLGTDDGFFSCGLPAKITM